VVQGFFHDIGRPAVFVQQRGCRASQVMNCKGEDIVTFASSGKSVGKLWLG
jgi:hypothetical protein